MTRTINVGPINLAQDMSGLATKCCWRTRREYLFINIQYLLTGFE